MHRGLPIAGLAVLAFAVPAVAKLIAFAWTELTAFGSDRLRHEAASPAAEATGIEAGPDLDAHRPASVDKAASNEVLLISLSATSWEPGR